MADYNYEMQLSFEIVKKSKVPSQKDYTSNEGLLSRKITFYTETNLMEGRATFFKYLLLPLMYQLVVVVVYSLKSYV